MLPNLGFIDTYSLMIMLGVLACFTLFILFKKKHNLEKNYMLDIFILACVAIIIGILSAVLFQMLFDSLKGEIRGTAMTFYGGLIGGVIIFVGGYFLVLKKRYKNASFVNDILPIAPACITVAHAFGRIGCFLAGCCYGKETDSWLGIVFPGHTNAVYPTQLFEAIFLFILTIVLFIIAIKKRWKHNLSLYLLTYGIFRFLIEFLRGDDRGGLLLNLSPSQFISILAIIASISLYIILQMNSNKENLN
jgi:phosphatidylglycerol:prolipoprotein diacylglycerol transferase